MLALCLLGTLYVILFSCCLGSVEQGKERTVFHNHLQLPSLFRMDPGKPATVISSLFRLHHIQSLVYCQVTIVLEQGSPGGDQ